MTRREEQKAKRVEESFGLRMSDEGEEMDVFVTEGPTENSVPVFQITFLPSVEPCIHLKSLALFVATACLLRWAFGSKS